MLQLAHDRPDVPVDERPHEVEHGLFVGVETGHGASSRIEAVNEGGAPAAATMNYSDLLKARNELDSDENEGSQGSHSISQRKGEVIA